MEKKNFVIFTIPGEPQGKARPKVVRNKYTGKVSAYTPEKTKDYEDLVVKCYRNAIKRIENLEKTLNAEQSCPFGSKKPYSRKHKKGISIRITAYYKYPARTSKKDKELMFKGKIVPTKKPDCDNIAKIICDALNGVAYEDDAQIVSLEVEKLYNEYPHVTVCITANDNDYEVCTATNTECTYCQPGACDSRKEPKKLTNFEKIKHMTLDEMAAFFDEVTRTCSYGECHKCPIGGCVLEVGCTNDSITVWLNQEVEIIS